MIMLLLLMITLMPSDAVSQVPVIENEVSKEDITVQLLPSKETYSLGGPVELTLVIQNPSQKDISLNILVPYNYPGGDYYPNERGLSFSPKNNLNDITQRKKSGEFAFPEVLNGPVAPLFLYSGDSSKENIYLNRYLNFQKPGRFEIKYSFKIHARREMQETSTLGVDLEFSNSFWINIESVTNQDLDQELEKFSEKLFLKSDFDQENFETFEGLCYLDTPLSIKYIAKALDLEGAEVVAAAILTRFNTPESLQYVEQALARFKNTKARVIRSILFESQKKRGILSYQVIRDLLLNTTNEITIRYTLQYIHAMKGKHFRSILSQFIKTKNTDKYLNKLARQIKRKL